MKASVFYRYGVRRRHPLLRIALTVVAFVVLGFASIFVALLALGVLGVWAARRAWQRLRGASPRPAPRQDGVIDAEYRVVASERPRLAPH